MVPLLPIQDIVKEVSFVNLAVVNDPFIPVPVPPTTLHDVVLVEVQLMTAVSPYFTELGALISILEDVPLV